jgi:hypothetical protein
VLVLVAIFFFAGRTGPLTSFGRDVDNSSRARRKAFESEFDQPPDESNLL